jgi:hypothetical protein
VRAGEARLYLSVLGVRGYDLNNLVRRLLLHTGWVFNWPPAWFADIRHVWGGEAWIMRTRTLDGNADQKGEQNVVSMNSLSTTPCARLMTGQESIARLNLKSPAEPNGSE